MQAEGGGGRCAPRRPRTSTEPVKMWRILVRILSSNATRQLTRTPEARKRAHWPTGERAHQPAHQTRILASVGPSMMHRGPAVGTQPAAMAFPSAQPSYHPASRPVRLGVHVLVVHDQAASRGPLKGAAGGPAAAAWSAQVCRKIAKFFKMFVYRNHACSTANPGRLLALLLLPFRPGNARLACAATATHSGHDGGHWRVPEGSLSVGRSTFYRKSEGRKKHERAAGNTKW